ncbi:lon protease homolog 2, peroxisomal isoform X2 [Sagmatias obliquidens]|uniref:Lon protease homolog n=1 Tax=Tursiops truncatus TaxID=9739 RepID=A0A2U4B4D1_TURTR|nr:lon protease homolog 2, peroxisomal isoform X2 [Tursiops truncatus]XP_026948017.1 lon protease homolog 2, peroxisomal isoform X2 [Lagenorhynchus obliquidens]
MSSLSPIQIPSRLPLLLTHEGVLLPGSTMRTSVDSARNLQLVRSRLLKGTSLQSTILGVIPNTPDPASDAQDLPPLHRIGTAALAVQVVGSNWPKPHYTLLITGLCRFQIVQVIKEKPYPVAKVEQLDWLEEFPNTCKTREELGELSEQFYKYAVQLVEMLDMSVPAVAKLRRLLDSLPREALPDILTSIIRTSNKEKLQILDAVSLEERFKMTIPLLVRQIEGLKLLQKTRKHKQDDDKRVIAIRPIRRITHIPGTLEDEDEDEDNDDIVMLEKKIRTSSMPDQAHKVCVKEIKRRTYVGSMPGRIINGLKTVGVNNPVFLLDEVDKLGKSLQGDPAAALLEVLDPEQNHNFTDHYLNVAFDLSQVLFIATANTTATIPPALLDRMEIIQVPGYTQEEKIEIAHRHLIPKQLEQHGLTPQQIQIPQVTTLDIITRYTREAGVRSLDRKLGAICRAVAVKVAEGQHREARLDRPDVAEGEGYREHIVEDTKPESINDTTDLALPPEMPILIDFHALKDILGPPMYEMEVSERLSQPGVAIGLAWTPLGGEIMFVEASRMDGEGQLTLTGQLGDVMKESAHLAISWLRSNAKKYHLTNASGSFDLLENTDIHLHFPAGAVTKDGPSAGVTIATCLASLFSGRLVCSDVAMTGEITLRGLVLPVGGIKDKVLAAHRAGLKRVIIPQRNEKDLEEIPGNVRQDLTFVTATCLDEVLNAAFDGGFTVSTRPGLLNSKL